MGKVWLCLCGVIAACGGGGGGGGDDGGNSTIDGRGTGDGSLIDGTPADAPPASPDCTPHAGTNVHLVPITTQVDSPVAITAPQGDGRLFIVEQTGSIRVVANGSLLSTPFLTVNVNDLGLEEGLLGLAFHPDFATNGRFFVLYTDTGGNGSDIRVAEYHADPGSNVADTTEKDILDIPHPYANDNGGAIDFGSDGYLYISVGDGGGADNFLDYADHTDMLLAKILRIDVDSGDPYAIPSDNPWATTGSGHVPEMFAWGFRNPWSMHVDRGTGDLWIGDVGQNTIEEVDVVRAGNTTGANYGWSVFEGAACFTNDPDGALDCDHPENFTFPVVAYDRSASGTGCVVITGGVYRGGCMPDLDGQVIMGDYCTGDLRTFPATATQLDPANLTTYPSFDPNGDIDGKLVAWGYDGYGELYVASREGNSVYRIETQ